LPGVYAARSRHERRFAPRNLSDNLRVKVILCFVFISFFRCPFNHPKACKLLVLL
jgi:hypothetical protein